MSVFANRLELLAQMKAVARHEQERMAPQENIQVGALTICTAVRSAVWRNKQLRLSLKEFDILTLLAQHAGQALARREMFDILWAAGLASTERLVDQHIMRLRHKLGDGNELIETVPGVGYRLRVTR